MSNQRYIFFNGNFYQENEAIFSAKNRAFRYGDALFETIRVIDGTTCFLEDHFNRLRKGIELLEFDILIDFYESLEKNINELIKKNKITQGGRVRLTVFRGGEGLYAPESYELCVVIEAIPIKDNDYIINETGLNIDVYRELKIYRSQFNQLKTTNCLTQVLAGIYKNKNNLDECIMLNDAGRIAETISSNIFLYKNNNLYTPATNEGCMSGVMRKQIIKAARELKINVFEGMVNGSMLLQADEFFLTNAIRGIQWIETYRQKKYSNVSTKEILAFINQMDKSSSAD